MYELTETTLDAILSFMGWLDEHADIPLLEKFRAGCDRGLAPLCACDCILCVAHARGELPNALADVCRSIPPERWERIPMAAFLLGQDFVVMQQPGNNPFPSNSD